MKSLDEAVEERNKKFREFILACMVEAGDMSVEKYMDSEAFEIDAEEFCRDTGWREPQ